MQHLQLCIAQSCCGCAASGEFRIEPVHQLRVGCVVGFPESCDHFMRAGAREVVAPLWEADEGANAQLMDWFYADLAQGSEPATALRDAKLKMLHSTDFHRRPYYWAPLNIYTSR